MKTTKTVDELINEIQAQLLIARRKPLTEGEKDLVRLAYEAGMKEKDGGLIWN